MQRPRARFLWRSNDEPMRTPNLFWSLVRVGVCLLNTKFQLLLQNFLFFRDQTDPFVTAEFIFIGNG